MRVLLTAQEMRAIDRLTIEEIGIPSMVLMENAGKAVAEAVQEELKNQKGTRVLVVCGKGNNGGDGMVAARHLLSRGISVDIAIVGEKEDLRGDAKLQLSILEKMGVSPFFISKKSDLNQLSPGDLIIDALLGTGTSGEVQGILASVIEWINAQSSAVVSVDIPSGIHTDTGACLGACVRATSTVTLAEWKRGLVLFPGRNCAGKVQVADIGIPHCAVQRIPCNTFYLEGKDIASWLPERPAHAHKGRFGKVLVLAGSTGMTGAATLTSLASLRAGAGLVVLGIPKSLNPILEVKLTEVITRPLAETPEGTLSLSAEPEIRSLLEWADVLAIGPGLSRNPETAELVRRIVMTTSLPLVLDADGINAFEGQAELLKKRKGPLILTPHPGELARLISDLGLSVSKIDLERIEMARAWSQKWNAIVVLKGAPTVVGDPEGNVYVNPTGNSGMATGGSGDVLTGLIAGFWAQKSTPLHSALCGVYVHGLAGDLASEKMGQRALLAGDILDSVRNAFLALEED